MKTIRTLIAASCIMGLAAAFVGTVSASSDWRGTKARVSSGNSQSVLRLWERGADAVVTYEVAGVVTDQTRCEGGILTDFDVAHKSAVVHADMNGADCTRIASNPLREPSRLAKSGRFAVNNSTAVDGNRRTQYVSPDPGDPAIVLDDATDLPVSITSQGQVVSFSYDKIESPAPPPAPALDSSFYVEQYRSASPADVAAAFKAKRLPGQIGGFQLDSTMTYDAGAGTGRAYYAFWRDKSGAEVQVVLNTRVPAGGPQFGFTDDQQQVSFRVFEGDSCLQVFAPDLSALRAAVAAVRPGLTAQLEHEIQNPTPPEMKPAPLG